MDFLPSLHTIFEFFVVWVIWRGIVVRWLSEVIREKVMKPGGGFLRKRLIKNNRDMAIWLHHYNKRLNKGHQCKLADCDDEWCRTI